MKKSNFEETMYSTLSTLTPDVLDKIKASDQFYVPEKTKKYDFSSFFTKRLSYSLASVFVLAIIMISLLSSNTSNPVVASTVTIDINPSIQITLDEDDNVINVSEINADGVLLIESTRTFRGLTLDETIEIIIEQAIAKGFIVDSTEENIILINVEANKAEIKARVEAALDTIITQEMNRFNHQVRVTREIRDELSEDEVNALKDTAGQYKLSYAKLLLINRIIAADDSYTIEDLKELPVKELYSILTTVDPEAEIYPGSGFGAGNN